MNYLRAKGWLSDGERRLLYHLALLTGKDDVIVNVGIEFGASLVCLREGNPHAAIVGIDIIGDTKVAFGKQQYHIEYIKGDSGDVAARWYSERMSCVTEPKNLVNLLFIDGDHSYKGVLRDTLFTNLLPVGGIVAFHDCYISPAAAEVNKAVTEWHEKSDGLFTELQSVDSIRVFRRSEIVPYG